MAVKTIQREVTSTIVKFARLSVVEGVAQVENTEKIFIGNVDQEKALKLLTKEMGSGVTVLSVEVDTQKYEMPVEDFIHMATKVEVTE